jgi:anthranilate phosphoribosyltransferase
MRELLLKLCRREDLTRDEARAAFEELTSGKASDAQIGGLLVGLASKGTTVEELVGAASVLREKAIQIPLEEAERKNLVDTCGTGGDVRETFNISTAAAIIAASAGARVVKHGNRPASGRCGSADVLEHLGVRIDCGPAGLRQCLRETGICFAYARKHHPVLRHVANARASLGIPTIFNIIAPLLNPAQTRRQVIGVFAPELTDRLAAVLRELGSEMAWVVHGDDGMDELSTVAPSRVTSLQNGHVHSWTVDPKDLGLAYARLSDLQVTDVASAASALTAAITGTDAPKRDIALLNAAAALVAAGVSGDLKAGLERARAALDTGAPQRTLMALVRVSQQAGPEGEDSPTGRA